jgi:hypothetical protein
MIIESLSILSIAFATCFFLSLRKNMEFMDKFDEIQEAIEESLVLLDVQKQKIDQKARMEVFSDEPVVRNLIKDIVESKNAVIKVAKLLDDSLVEEINESKEAEE